jgi:hypothetical protein
MFNKIRRLYSRATDCLFTLTVFCLVLLLSAPSALSDQLNVGDKAPNLIGNDAISGDRMNLYLMMTRLQFKRDNRGFLVVGAGGKYVNEFVRNILVLNFFSRI